MRLKKEIKKDYTTVHNDFLWDKSLGINARGLLVTMLSKSDDWNFSIKGLAALLPDGEKKVATALKELEKNGYLVRERISDDSGKIIDWNYIISDQKLPDDILEKSFKIPYSQNGNMEKPHACFGDVDKADVVKADVENRHDYKRTNIYNTNKYIINQPIIHSEHQTDVEKSNENDMNDMIRRIKENISYDYLILNYSEDIIFEVAMIIVDCVMSNASTIRVAGSDIATEIVRSRFLKLECNHIQYVMDCMQNNNTKIINIKSYMITALYNSLSTINNYYGAEVRYDFNVK